MQHHGIWQIVHRDGTAIGRGLMFWVMLFFVAVPFLLAADALGLDIDGSWQSLAWVAFIIWRLRAHSRRRAAIAAAEPPKPAGPAPLPPLTIHGRPLPKHSSRMTRESRAQADELARTLYRP